MAAAMAGTAVRVLALALAAAGPAVAEEAEEPTCDQFSTLQAHSAAAGAGRQRELGGLGASAGYNTGYPECYTWSCPKCSGEPCLSCVHQTEIECCLDYECHGCSGEQCTYCRRDHQRGCCLGKWMAQYTGKCDGVSLPNYESCPRCGPAPCPNCTQALDIDACLDDACSGCSGEQCTYCRQEHATVKGCCLGKWAASYTGKCAGVSLPDYLSCTRCGGEPCPICVQQKDVQFLQQQECSGCSGEQCTHCLSDICERKSFAEYIPECQ